MRTLARSSLFLLLAAAPFVAHAQWYVGIGAGQTMLRESTNPAATVAKTDTGYGVFGGYDINKYFAAELGYADLGRFAYSFPGVTGSSKVTSWYLAGRGTWPLTAQFSLYGKIGAADERIRTTQSAGAIPSNLNDNDTAVFAGVGAEYNFTRQIGVSLEYNQVGKGVNDAKAETLSLGLRYHF